MRRKSQRHWIVKRHSSMYRYRTGLLLQTSVVAWKESKAQMKSNCANRHCKKDMSPARDPKESKVDQIQGVQGQSEVPMGSKQQWGQIKSREG